MRLDGKVALITGAASGIGENIARLFAKEGATIIVADMLEAEGREIVESLKKQGHQAAYVQLDVRDEADWQRAFESGIAQFGKVDTVISNAGISGYVPDRESTAYMDDLMAVHLRGTFLAFKHGAKAIGAAGGGAIVAMSSVAAYSGFAGMHMGYCAAKGGILAMVRCAAGEYAKAGVRVNAVVPGLLPSMRTSVVSADPEMRAKFFERVPLGRPGERADAANACLFLASSESAYVTGADIVVDGGYLIY